MMHIDRWTGLVTGTPREDLYVYEAPVRLWHWVTVLCVFTLAVTGYFIGSPPPAIGGEAVDSFYFGWIRTVHFVAAWILIAVFIVRVYWAFAGNRFARMIFLPPLWRGSFWRGILSDLREYSFAGHDENVRWACHNPLALLAMTFMFVFGIVFIMITGLGLYAQASGWGSTWMNLFGWVTVLFGSPQAVRTAHHLAMWYMLLFAAIHIYMVFRQDIMSRGTIISTMICGIRNWKGEPRG